MIMYTCILIFAVAAECCMRGDEGSREADKHFTDVRTTLKVSSSSGSLSSTVCKRNVFFDSPSKKSMCDLERAGYS